VSASDKERSQCHPQQEAVPGNLDTEERSVLHHNSNDTNATGARSALGELQSHTKRPGPGSRQRRRFILPCHREARRCPRTPRCDRQLRPRLRPRTLSIRSTQAAPTRHWQHCPHRSPPPMHGDARRRLLHHQRRLPNPRRKRIPHHHRPKHGRQINLHPPNRRHRPNGADRLLRPLHRSRAHPLRLHPRPRRRQRQPAQRRQHVHGRDARDSQYSENCHSAAAPARTTASASRGPFPSTL
jgi:hypothetical protein